MNLKEFIAVTGLPGLYKLLSVRGDGVIIEDFDTQQRRFVGVRKHQYSPLQTISIYTVDDKSIALGQVFTNMFELLSAHPLPSEKADSKTLRNYFKAILPNHDPERVHTSDIKKAIKWFSFLLQRDLLHPAVENSDK